MAIGLLIYLNESSNKTIILLLYGTMNLFTNIITSLLIGAFIPEHFALNLIKIQYMYFY